MADVEKRLNSSLADLISESKGSARDGKVSLTHSLLGGLCAFVKGNGAGCARCTSCTPERPCGLCGTQWVREGSVDIGMSYRKPSTHRELLLSVPVHTCKIEVLSQCASLLYSLA